LNNETASLPESLTVTHPGRYLYFEGTTTSPTGEVNQLMPQKIRKSGREKRVKCDRKEERGKTKGKFQLKGYGKCKKE
jgi:hypothetical protein